MTPDQNTPLVTGLFRLNCKGFVKSVEWITIIDRSDRTVEII